MSQPWTAAEAIYEAEVSEAFDPESRFAATMRAYAGLLFDNEVLSGHAEQQHGCKCAEIVKELHDLPRTDHAPPG